MLYAKDVDGSGQASTLVDLKSVALLSSISPEVRLKRIFWSYAEMVLSSGPEQDQRLEEIERYRYWE
jgi:hypothetical protein